MSGFKSWFFSLLFICTFIELYQCRRGGGGGRSGGGRPPSYGWKPSPSPSYHPSPSPSYHPSPYRPSPSPYRPSPKPPTNRPSSARPPPSHPPAYPSTARPYGNRPSSRPGPTPPPQNRPGTRHTTPRHYGGSTKSPTWSGLPPRPGSKDYKPQGPPVNQHITYKIKNKYYSYPGQYSLPMPSPHVGYYYTPSYHYSSHDTGSTALGFFLGYSLGHMSTPTYSHYSFYDGYRPQYDHYTVHHYYHNRESVPAQQEIRSNNIVGCIADSANVCPGNTVSLCTSTGTLMCVVNAASTVPCADNRALLCVQSTINCANNTATECQNKKTATISVPCVSNAKIYGDIKLENNTIVTLNNTINNNTNTTSVNNSTATTNGTNTTIITTTPEYSTKYPITTTPVPLLEQTATNTTSRKKREVPQNFCVTVLAVPAKKPPTEGEKVYDDAKGILSDFWESAWGV